MKNNFYKISFLIVFTIGLFSILGIKLFTQGMPEKVGSVTSISGSVEVTNDDETKRIRTGQIINEKDELYVSEDSSVKITFNNGCEITAEGPAEFIIEENIIDSKNKSNNIIITQISGIIDAIFDNKTNGTVTINTPSSVVGVRGTKFVTIVGDDGSLYLGVTEGSVALSYLADSQEEIKDDNIKIDENSVENIDNNISKQLTLNKTEILVNTNEEIEIRQGDEIQALKPKKLQNLNERKKNFLLERKKHIIENFQDFAKRVSKSFAKVPLFIRTTEKRIKLFIKIAKDLNETEQKITNNKKLTKKAKERKLERLAKIKTKTLENGLEFFKDTYQHSKKILASFRIMEKLPKIIEGTEISKTDDYLKLIEEYQKVKDIMKTYLKVFKEKTQEFINLLFPTI